MQFIFFLSSPYIYVHTLSSILYIAIFLIDFFPTLCYVYSPTKASGGMFSNVTGKVSGWLPSSLPTVSMPSVSMPTMPTVSMPAMPSIPGLRKSHHADAEVAELAPEQAEEAQPSQTANEKDDDDRSRFVEFVFHFMSTLSIYIIFLGDKKVCLWSLSFSFES